MTWARTRIQEAIVDKFSADASLIALTCDGERDDIGTLHHIGLVLNEAGMKGRTPYLGIQIGSTVSAIEGVARAHLFRSKIMVHVFSTDECTANKIMDRVQYLLTTDEDNCVNGFYDFTNAHIRNSSTEFTQRFSTEFDRNLDVYTEMLEFEIVWSDVPCSLEIEEPSCDYCSPPGLYAEYDDLPICDYDCMI